MAEILFYHLTHSPLEAMLPDLLQKSLDRGWKVLVRSGSPERLKWLDERLWSGDEASFLPHGLEGGPHDTSQPVLLSTGRGGANAAEILFAVDRAVIDADEVGDFARVCLIFDGNDAEALDAARADWKRLTEAGHPATYWSQESGRWQARAKSGG